MDLALYGNKADYLDRYRGHVAINVKYHGDPKVSKETLAVLAKLDGALREQVLRFAEEGLRESWWSAAQDRARSLDLGNLWSEGRSGGWLVFDLSVDKLAEMVYEAEAQCAHCGQGYVRHQDGKCLFDTTTYVSGMPSCELTWANLKLFAEEMKDSLQTAGDTFEEEILFQLEHLDGDTAAGLSPSRGNPTNTPAFDYAAEEQDG